MGIRHDEMHRWLAEEGVFLVGGNLDEAPQADRRLGSVATLESNNNPLERASMPSLNRVETLKRRSPRRSCV